MINKHVRGSAAVLLLSVAAFSGSASAAGDAEAGSEKIATCVACHDAEGQGTAGIYPNLAGQSATYLESALKAYREGQRAGGMAAVMTPQAANLSDQDIADLAAYYSSL
ncbi:c-type cytochrome [Halomonas marinisediminis]|uniref:Cytochrome c n=1 Tax=Halomonas marinisediminis TaxID=2546095 RepID=A0ABY2DAS8_9GAMM|nr:cytochrome c [Halomonas marinisediminis]TDB05423.1 cytochrome c [Halomonas marinisediminis]